MSIVASTKKDPKSRTVVSIPGVGVFYLFVKPKKNPKQGHWWYVAWKTEKVLAQSNDGIKRNANGVIWLWPDHFESLFGSFSHNNEELDGLLWDFVERGNRAAQEGYVLSWGKVISGPAGESSKPEASAERPCKQPKSKAKTKKASKVAEKAEVARELL